MITVSTPLVAQFYDLDPMQVVWHGHYARYLEQARSHLMDHIGYNYAEMAASGYVWPVVEMQLKYIRPIKLQQRIVVQATLTEYENRLRITYVISDEATSQVLTKAQTTQVAVTIAEQEMQFETPSVFQDCVKRLLS